MTAGPTFREFELKSVLTNYELRNILIETGKIDAKLVTINIHKL